MMTFLMVCLAGSFGACSRFGMNYLGNMLFYDTYLPLPTLFINVLASFLLGFAAGMLPATSIHFQVISGFFGGFSTYSTFTTEFTNLMHDFPKVATGYIALSIGLGIAGAALGFGIARL